MLPPRRKPKAATIMAQAGCRCGAIRRKIHPHPNPTMKLSPNNSGQNPRKLPGLFTLFKISHLHIVNKISGCVPLFYLAKSIILAGFHNIGLSCQNANTQDFLLTLFFVIFRFTEVLTAKKDTLHCCYRTLLSSLITHIQFTNQRSPNHHLTSFRRPNIIFSSKYLLNNKSL
jgi:hypothetical protein